MLNLIISLHSETSYVIRAFSFDIYLFPLGNAPYSMRSLKNSLALDGHTLLSQLVPQSVNIPRWVFSLSSSKFAR